MVNVLNEKTATYLSLVFVVLFGAYFFLRSLPMYLSNDMDISAGYLPFWLSIILFILCIISFVKTKLEKKERKLVIPKAKYIVITVALIVLFLLSWSYFSFFYVQTFVFILILLTIYKIPTGLTKRSTYVNVSIALGFSMFTYILFDVVMNVKF